MSENSKSQNREIRRKKAKQKFKCMCEVAKIFFPNSTMVLMTKEEKKLYDEWSQKQIIYKPTTVKK